MSSFIRASKYRHVYVEPPKVDQTYKGFRLATVTGEQQYIKANTTFFAVALQGGGGPFAVVKHKDVGEYKAGTPLVAGHKSAVLDLDFNPFHEHVIASASEDSTIKIWGIPADGLTETLTEPLVDLHGHGRKVTLLRFHPTANNVLASVSADMAVKVWDIEKGSESASCEEHKQLIQDIVWDHEGKVWATSSKDKKLRLGDPRSKSIVGEIDQAHAGAKSTKLSFLGGFDRLCSVGFTKQSQRQIKFWDVKKLGGEPVHQIQLDQASGVIIPYYDVDTRVLYLAGKGDGNIRYYENIAEKPWAFALSEYRSTQAAKGTCFVPKRGLDVMRCETARCLKLVSQAGKGSVEPLSFIVPRKSDAFQDDIFPDAFCGAPSMTADEWWAGANAAPRTAPLDPAKAGNGAAPVAKTFTKVKTAAQLQKELDEALAKIARLEKKLADAGLSAE
jgi:coronin-1B/1C/6|mmetsp:Transcript_10779/g.28407  ORF Transcript_10779/g.28407 Transcript_10779/m.28407 type:complete len:446 (+) Transcript_10779:230-1567(+)